MKEDKLVLKWEGAEFPVTKIGNCRFSITKPNESKGEEFVVVRGANGKAEYLHIARHALKKSEN